MRWNDGPHPIPHPTSIHPTCTPVTFVPICVLGPLAQRVCRGYANCSANRNGGHDESRSASGFHHAGMRLRGGTVSGGGHQPGSCLRRREGQDLRQSWPSTESHSNCGTLGVHRLDRARQQSLLTPRGCARAATTLSLYDLTSPATPLTYARPTAEIHAWPFCKNPSRSLL